MRRRTSARTSSGVPLGSIVKDEASNLLSFNESMKAWVKGQDHAIDVIDAGDWIIDQQTQ